MVNVRIFRSPFTNIFTNLALEEWLFRTLPLHEGDLQAMMLWRNSPSIVLGRNQNPWVECNVKQMLAQGVVLARRSSGGGAVYHDLQNLCITFFSPNAVAPSPPAHLLGQRPFSKARNANIMVLALKSLGVAARSSDRTDLLVDFEGAPKKISGSAYRISGHRAYHHCTLLIDTELQALRSLLRPPERQIDGRGVPSVPHPVINLSQLQSDISYTTLCDALATSFCSMYGQPCVPIEGFDMHAIEQDPIFRSFYDEIRTNSWIYGETPSFDATLQRTFDWGQVHMKLHVHKGMIDVKDLYVSPVKSNAEPNAGLIPHILRNALQSTPYRLDSVHEAIQRINGIPVAVVEDLMDWLPDAL